MHPKITLVGAGPGDPELLTLKGARALASADAVLYDALVDERLLDHAPPHAARVYVGKRAGAHHRTQEEINLLLVQYALSHGHVVRLKGGDPFVFGRGHEELAYAEAFGIATSVVPGLSSCTSLPALQGVPVTRRGVSESFWVLTGTTREGRLSRDVYDAARSRATVVILMGMRRLERIAEVFAAAGQAETSVLVVERGSTDAERSVVGTVGDIAARVAAAGIGSPGVIVIGEAVGLHPAATAAAAWRAEAGL